MISRLALAGLLSIGGMSGALAESSASPRGTVEALYVLVIADQRAPNPTSPFVEPRQRRPYFSKGFDALVTRVQARDAKAREATLDFDPLVSGQDSDVSHVDVEEGRVVGDTATVAAHFVNFGRKTTVTFALVREGDAWRVDDVEGHVARQAWSVRTLLGR